MRVRSTHCTNQELFLNGRAMSGDANCTDMAFNCQKCRPDPTILSYDTPERITSFKCKVHLEIRSMEVKKSILEIRITFWKG